MSDQEMCKNKNDDKNDSEALQILHNKMEFYNFADSFGTIILRNGVVIHIRSFFEYFREYWNDFKTAESIKGKVKLNKIMKDTGGGILTNGEVDVDIKEIVATVSVHKIIKHKKNKQPHFPEDEDEERTQIINDDNINEIGDSEF